MLRIVKPSSEGQGSRPPPRRRSSGLSLRDEEARHLRVALNNLRWAYGSWSCLAEVMGIEIKTLCKFARGASRGSAAIALRAAQAAGMHVEVLLSGTLSVAGRCPTCGSRVGDRPVTPTSQR